jgi:hypothetical protein
MTVAISYFAGAGWQFFDNNGVPLAGGLIYTYAAGTTTPQATYTSSTGVTANPNPIVLNSAGRVPNEIWLTSGVSYKFVLKDSTGVQIGSYDNLSSVNDFTSVFTTLAASSGSSLIGYTQGSTNAVATTVQSKLREVVSVKDFGAKGDGTTNDTSAIQTALNYISSVGGGIVHLPAGNYVVSQLDVPSDVTLQGEINGYSYTTAKSTSILTCTTGVYAVMLEGRATLRDLGINSNASTSGPPYAVQGVEYGVVIYFGSTVMTNVSVFGFQYGVTIANGGNSNIFENCAFNWNSKAGFVNTIGTQAAFDLYHPNLPYPQYLGSNYFQVSTIYTLRNCNISRNRFGVIIRDGNPYMDRVLIESNFYAGLFYLIGSLDSSAGGSYYGAYIEANWADYVRPGPSYTISDITVLFLSSGTPLTLTSSNDPAVDENGFQIYFYSTTATNVITNVEMHRTSVVNSGTSKQMWLQSAFCPVFNFMGSSGGDQTNAVRFNGSSGQVSTAAQFIQYQGTLPATLGDRGVSYSYETGQSGGGITATSGYYRGLAGNVTYFATPKPVTSLGNYTATPEATSIIFNYAGTSTLTLRPASETGAYPQEGRWIYVKTITANTVISASSNIVPLAGGAAGTAILSATAGKWAILQSDGTNWVIMASN